jgi:hypothetical protein
VTLSGSVSAAIHGIEWHRKYDNEFTLGDPSTSRAAVAWPLAPFCALAGDVIAINVGIARF